MTEFLDELEAAGHLFAHGGGEHDVLSLALSLGLVEGHVGVLDELIAFGIRAAPHHNADAGVLLQQ